MVRVVLYVPTALYSHIWFSWNKNAYHYTRKNECAPFKEIAGQNATALSAATGGHLGQKTDSLMQRERKVSLFFYLCSLILGSNH